MTTFSKPADGRSQAMASARGMQSRAAVVGESNVILLGSFDEGGNGGVESNAPARFINISSLPPGPYRDQLEVLDIDGDGNVDLEEIAEAANTQKTLKGQNSLLRKGVAFAVGMSCALVVVLGGTVYAIVENSKEATVEGRALMTKSHEPISINVNEANIPFGALSFMPGSVPSKMDELTVKDEKNMTHYFKSDYVAVVPEKSTMVKTATGDTIVWDSEVDGGAKVHVTMSDGTSWSLPTCCSDCSMTSVVADEEILGALENYHASQLDRLKDPTQGGRRLWLNSCEDANTYCGLGCGFCCGYLYSGNC